jgi:hypothetical protein
MADATDWEIDSKGWYGARGSVPSTVWLLLRHIASFMPLHHLAQCPNRAASHSTGNPSGSHLSKGAGAHAESPDTAGTAQQQKGPRRAASHRAMIDDSRLLARRAGKLQAYDQNIGLL